MFGIFKKAAQSLFTSIRDFCSSTTTVDESDLQKLEHILLDADVGIKTTRLIVERLRASIKDNPHNKPLLLLLEDILLAMCNKNPEKLQSAPIHLLVGINGSGKTTCAGKLAHHYKMHNRRVLLVAADTYRAAATEQLIITAKKYAIEVVTGNEKQDPASVVFAGCAQYLAGDYDHLIIDTAGRLQTRTSLMHELAKIRSVITKKLPAVPVQTLLTIDATLGQNGIEQARAFLEHASVSGIILTKTDGSAKGGIILAIAHELGIPVAYASDGEAITDLAPFNTREYIHHLIGDSGQQVS